jgi:hypothetical protein
MKFSGDATGGASSSLTSGGGLSAGGAGGGGDARRDSSDISTTHNTTLQAAPAVLDATDDEFTPVTSPGEQTPAANVDSGRAAPEDVLIKDGDKDVKGIDL